MLSTEAPRPPSDSELARELTYSQKQLLASGRTSEVVRVVRRRSRRRAFFGLLLVGWVANQARVLFVAAGPPRLDLWARVLLGVFMVACACLSLALTVHTYRKERDYVELLQRHDSGDKVP